MLFGKNKLTVGREIMSEDITDFYYTIDASTNPPIFQRFHIYFDDGEHYFAYEKREGDHWPLTEDDITDKETVKLNEEKWNEFYDFLKDGKVSKRKDDVTDGGRGPFLFLYSSKDRGLYQEFEFDTYKKQKSFENMCNAIRNADGGKSDV